MQSIPPQWMASSGLAVAAEALNQEAVTLAASSSFSCTAADSFAAEITPSQALTAATEATQPAPSPQPTPAPSTSLSVTTFALSAAACLGLYGCSGQANVQGAQAVTGGQVIVSHDWNWALVVATLALCINGYFAARRFGLTREVDPFIDMLFFGIQRRLGLRNGFEFYTDVNELFRTRKLEPAHERADQYVRLRDLLQSNLRKIPVVVGPLGSGKSHFLIGIAHEILKGNIPEIPKDSTSIFRFSLAALPMHKDLTYFGYTITEWRIFSKQVDRLLRKGRHVVILMDGIDRFVTSGAVDGTANDLMSSIYYKMLQWRANPKAVVVGATRPALFDEKIQATDMANYVQRLDLPLLTPAQVAKIVDTRAGRWASESENIQISYEARKRALELSQHPEIKKHLGNPQASLRILDVAFAKAKRIAYDKDEKSPIFKRDHTGKKVWSVSVELADRAAAEMFHIPVETLTPWNLNPPPVTLPPPPAPVLPAAPVSTPPPKRTTLPPPPKAPASPPAASTKPRRGSRSSGQ